MVWWLQVGRVCGPHVVAEPSHACALLILDEALRICSGEFERGMPVWKLFLVVLRGIEEVLPKYVYRILLSRDVAD